MGRAEILALAVGRADEVFLVLRKVGSAALIHFTAALCAIQKPGEHTHFTHLGRTATRLANVLNNQKHAFLDDRRLGVLEDHPVRRVIPDFLLALVGLSMLSCPTRSAIANAVNPISSKEKCVNVVSHGF